MHTDPIKDITLTGSMSANQLINHMKDSGGFTAKHIAEGVDILETMITDPNCTCFLSFPACLIATGTRGIIKQLIQHNHIDCVITTSGTLDHDLARIWEPYHHGTFFADDKTLHHRGINRLGNIFIPTKSYGTILEQKLQPIFKTLFSTKPKWSTKELIWEVGRHIKNEPNATESILYWAAKNKIPLYVPGITDGAFGSQLWLYYQTHRDITMDLFRDEQDLSDTVFDAKKTGALILGGGISKHHTIWWNQFKDGLDYAVYITTAYEYDGSLSGAQTREAISWGKLKEHAQNITIYGEATALLPLMISALFERIQKKKKSG